MTSENTADISPYRKRFTYVQAFNVVLMGLKRNLTIIEFAPNQIVTFRKLESSGVTLGQLHDFCDSVYDYVDNNEYFSIKSIKQTGFVSELFELGFSDWFYSNLLLSDDRFVNASMFNVYHEYN